MRSIRTESRDRPPRAVTYNYIHFLTFNRVVDLLQVDRSGVYSGVQAGAIVVGFKESQAEHRRTLEAAMEP